MNHSLLKNCTNSQASEPSENEVSIKVMRFEEIVKPEKLEEKQTKFSNPLSKIVFFFFREGPFLTWHKVRASYLTKKIANSRRVVIAFGYSADEKFFMSVGPQCDLDCDIMVFPNSSSIQFNYDEQLVDSAISVMQRYFQENPNIYSNLLHYSPFSGIRPKLNLERVFCKSQKICYNGQVPSTIVSTIEKKKERGVERKRIKRAASGKYGLFIVGAGAYVQAYILPSLKGLSFDTVIDLNPAVASIISKKYAFKRHETSFKRSLSRLTECERPIVIIATYHSTHVDIAEQALTANPNAIIFIEKPPVTTYEQLDRLLTLRDGGAFIEIGYNRRYSPMIHKAKAMIDRCAGPITMTCIIKELKIPGDHWYYWPTQGTRITGNLCHWIDLGCYFIEQKPVAISALSPPDVRPGDEITAAITFQDGSRLSLIASDRGNPLRGVQEYLDIRREDVTVIIDDCLRMTVQEGGRKKSKRRLIRDKGHRRMYKSFVDNIRNSRGPIYPNEDLRVSSKLYLILSDMARNGETFRRLDDAL